MEIKRLKGTNKLYKICGLFSHRCGTDNGEPIMEEWAKCKALDGKDAYWKLSQLEDV
jgi:hypothetical protein